MLLFNFFALPTLALGFGGILMTFGISSDNARFALQLLVLASFPFLILPFALQMLLNKAFRNFQLIAVQSDDSLGMSFRDSISAAWLLFWRANIVGLLILVGTGSSFMFMVSGGFAGALGTYVNLLAYPNFVAYPIVMRMMIRKRYRSFRFEIAREVPGPSPHQETGYGTGLFD